MGYTYATFKAALAQELTVSESDTDFLATLPIVIDDAEQRCYRDLDLLTCVVNDVTATLTAGSRNFTLPIPAIGQFVNVRTFNVFTGTYPAGRIQLLPLGRSVIDFLYPAEAVYGTENPKFYAPVTDRTFIIAPASASNMTVEIVGTVRPTALSAAHTTTFLSLYLSDLFLAAAMSSATGALLKNFSAQADDPKMAMSWENQYQMRLSSSDREEMRRKFAFGGGGGRTAMRMQKK